MKRNLFYLISALLISGMVQAQELDWKGSLDKVKGLIQTNPSQAENEIGELIKGKNKKNTDFRIVFIG